MARIFALAFACFALSFVTACGGGGEDEAPQNPGAPGTLRALAVEGEMAPDSGGGTFDAFPTFPIMDAATNAWSAFVATISGGTTTSAVYVVQPDAAATRVLAFKQGDGVAGTDRMIADFAGVWMCENGTVVALANLTGGANTQDFALLAADVAGGLVSNTRVVILDEASLVAVVAAGVLSDIDPMTLLKENDGTLWFLATDSAGGGTHLVSIELDGTGLRKRVSPGDSISGTTDVVASVDAFGIDPLGAFYGWAVTDSGGVRRVNLRGTAAMTLINEQVQADSDPLPSFSGNVADAWKRGRITVYGDASIVWVAKGDQSGADDVVMFYKYATLPTLPLYRELARVTETAPNTGLGTWNRLDALNSAGAAQRVLFNGGVSGGTGGVTDGTFRVAGINPVTVVGETVNTGSATYISLRQTVRPYDEVSFGGDMGYGRSFSGTSGLFWLVRAVGGVFTVAAETGPAPGGDTFTSFIGGAALTIAPGIFLFRAGLTTAGSGIFRQGP